MRRSAPSRPTSSTSVAVRAPRSWPTACTSSSATSRSSRSSSTSSAASPSCDAVANGIVGALKVLGDEATKPLVVRLDGNNVEEGRQILADFNHPLVTIESTRWTAPRQKAAELAAAAKLTLDVERTDKDTFLTWQSSSPRLQGHRPGHDRLRGHEAHRPACSPPAPPSSAASTPARPAPPSSSSGEQLRPRLRLGRRGDEGHRRRRVGRLRPAGRSPSPPSIEAIDAGIRPRASSSPRASPVKDTAEFFNYSHRQGHPDHRPELPRPHQPRQVQRRHHPGTTSPAPAASVSSPSRAR